MKFYILRRITECELTRLPHEYYSVNTSDVISGNPYDGVWRHGNAMILTHEECVRIMKHFPRSKMQPVAV